MKSKSKRRPKLPEFEKESLPDGRCLYTFRGNLAQKLVEIQGLVSVELGRPVSFDEAMTHMLAKTLAQLEAESGAAFV